MSYVKTNWVDQEGQVKYKKTDDGEYWILTPNYEDVYPIGTPVNADNLNHIEDGIADAYDYVNTQITAMLGALYPVGSIYIGTQGTCPLETLGVGTWTKVSAGRVLQGADSSHAAGTTIAAGLPNISGSLTAIAKTTESNTKSDGCLRSTTVSSSSAGYTPSYSAWGRNLSFNASNSSAIYRNDVTTVQPPAYVVNIWRRTA